jgi:HD-GYP domain-containing protein (c-di-GMP phosphodiesterase class II)
MRSARAEGRSPASAFVNSHPGTKRVEYQRGLKVLLLTDDAGEGQRLQRALGAAQACEVVALDDALKHKPEHSAIACLASFDPETTEQLREALSHHRTDPRIPVLFLMRDPSLYASTQAEALGATALLPSDASDDQIIAAARRMAEVVVDPAPQTARAESVLEADVAEIGAALVELMQAAKENRQIPLGLLDQGAERLVTSMRRTGIRQWLDFVRRHDDLTYQHCLLVAGLVAGFASRLGIAPGSQKMLAQAALVHDIGKASIPRHILHKTGLLSADEMALIRRHPADGHALLTGQRGIDARVLAVVRHHHEYLDGSGYPDRLRASQIPDFVRLVTVCDIYAALVERRTYKPPIAPAQAQAMLVAMGGKLDQGLVAAFGRLVAEM